jgi:Trypsin
MLRRAATGLTLLLAAATLAAAPPAGAVVGGSMSSLGSYTVRLVGNGYCSGVAIARRIVATAAHCARGMHVMTGSGSVRVIGVSRSALLDDGRRVSISGDGAFLRLAAPLPSGVGPPPIGTGSGDSFTIAGYGTTDERAGAAFGSLHEATLVTASARALVDPHRSGSIGASACFGDSGGPVMRGGVLVGVITRAAHPSPRIACGKLTRWAAITVRGQAREGVTAANNADVPVAEPRRAKHRRHARRAHETETHSAGLFGNWFTEKVDTHPRHSARHKAAQRASP